MAGNHGFVDGNKRTAFVLFHLLIGESGYVFVGTSTTDELDDVEHLITDLTTRFLNFEELTLWLKNRFEKA